MILRDSSAIVVHNTNAELADVISLLSRQPIPSHRFGVVAGHAQPPFVTEAKVALRNRISLLGREQKFLN